jgi:hypothetical protein
MYHLLARLFDEYSAGLVHAVYALLHQAYALTNAPA